MCAVIREKRGRYGVDKTTQRERIFEAVTRGEGEDYKNTNEKERGLNLALFVCA